MKKEHVKTVYSNSSQEAIEYAKRANFAVEKILEGTGITIESLIEEGNKKDWFKP
ncbi:MULTISPECIES: hypothetical protein [Bacillus]|uniref:hypothetical protein n=1 Tax=Bacillus TaxID=1386 RepID=UPI0013E8B345|nr:MULTISPECIES: hypothetical protein [Bacillus]MDU0070053.1 hypothetical protein [Bacillus sp. IG6]MED8017726.1 hypothetical protein [Bacillus glycinifermentans]